jgi:hypothetical protein
MGTFVPGNFADFSAPQIGRSYRDFESELTSRIPLIAPLSMTQLSLTQLNPQPETSEKSEFFA